MASSTMATSFLGGVTVSGRGRPTTTTTPRRVIIAKASSMIEGGGEQVKLNESNKKNESNNGRRDLMFAAAAAAACSIAGAAFADEPKRGSPEAKKKYAPICVTMPTARICRY